MAPKEDSLALAEAWNHGFGFIKTSIVKTAVELGIPDILESRGAPVSIPELAAAVDCSADRLYRVMRFLAYHGIFKRTEPPPESTGGGSVYYAQTLVSRRLTRENLGPFVLLQGTMREPSGCVTAETLRMSKRPGLVDDNDSDRLYEDPVFSMKVFRDAMASHARMTTAAVIENYGEGFLGVGSLVDVGGSYGMALSMLVKAFPWLRGICFDLPEVVARASPLKGVEFVAGSMFESIPKADVVMLMFVLHNWSDEECVEILKRCKDAVPKNKGKVIIIDAVIDEDGNGDEFTGARLGLDVTMMANMFEGRERTYVEWAHIINEAGFRRHVVKNIKTLESVIEAYP
uniref:Flavonoid 7-O-methyltransferase 1B n=1 Tax=Mentha piperita TaxID=34256 RepID=OMT1B_MENPI|nr:RecName: Full=Flavonoid 7-O-methyltransferase 1B; Short=MpOMT1B; AltName: Full=7,8,4'-trihydroxy-flavone 7-O-methyltransferase; AltName: Full=Apigenin 7-O-methyltransferase; AltName: Full=Isorhamnetin 7-O-methyltransferase; AltName: Full=Kaempferol 7-O-methyltransferase; AltName: Full=Luteolin 7-O-methyltransferase; AltName: Full=Naringenin 7-O-methyltransferase; AltName: Full=Quercetin 7-O-methyltransferase; AltName: Full=Scutellarein 7-O-methyltransferase [Mentha x piperita]AAR09599.1 flavono